MWEASRINNSIEKDHNWLLKLQKDVAHELAVQKDAVGEDWLEVWQEGQDLIIKRIAQVAIEKKASQALVDQRIHFNQIMNLPVTFEELPISCYIFNTPVSNRVLRSHPKKDIGCRTHPYVRKSGSGSMCPHIECDVPSKIDISWIYPFFSLID